ncbi:glycerol-3-phosphate dehydrogenase/oxidase [Protaetiibacter sp. SSC-01]|uniref:glycerol-3-phosphate dehydrogenase/oxidase n=1 Tax=Protaetiibacter sp. SSC-01 TaxID=2759943 RepID=UPI001656CD2B|nr:glycerol-3-phosphate dehydrogenase/oxidase [Protaetiibacter sp. SSC-01]QNO36827.1 glycerol-3-phosphate dehydrogenase/oxidase [Protaetiibacter sp. SSC-01]
MSPRPRTALRPEVARLMERGRTQVLVIGGGINGIATFRDLALQGLDVVLVERDDFASAASAASSHMIHGGIRYLENGEFRLVKESVQERNALLRTAPHRVVPLETTIPIYSTFSGILSAPLRFLTHRHRGRPKERGALLIKIGLTIYDTFSREGGVVPRHRFRVGRRAHADLPALDPRVRYSATYFDAAMHDPERLALDVLLDATASSGATAVNYVEAVGMDADGVRVRDRETGREFTVRADVVVNASGPWTDLTNAALGHASRWMGGTKGSHIVLDHPELLAATRGREIFFEHSDGRIVLIYPLKDRVMVGTTDIDADPAEPVRCTEEEVDYFFGLIRHVFPSIEVDRPQIVYRFSGIRPLPRHEDTQPGFVSRDYRVEVVRAEGSAPVVSLVGGKWTTFRAIGEAVADAVLEVLGRRREVSTRGRVIRGSDGYPRGERERGAWLRARLTDVDADRRELLFARYGTAAAEVAVFMGEQHDAPIGGGVLSTGELRWMLEREHVEHLTDIVLRRTDLAFTGRLDAALLDEIAKAVSDIAGWDAARRELEVATCTRELAEVHAVDLSVDGGR